jgi:WD40 repeat protein
MRPNASRVLRLHTACVRSVSFSCDGTTLASASDDKTVRVWNAKTAQQLHALQTHADWVRTVAFSPDGNTLVSGSDDCSIQISSPRTGKQFLKLPTLHWAHSVAFAPDGRSIAASSDNGPLIQLWSVESGQLLQSLIGGRGKARQVVFAPDGQTLIGAGWNVTVWNVKTGALIHQLGGGSMAVCVASNGDLIVAGLCNGKMPVWNAQTGALMQVLSGHHGIVTGTAFLRRGSALVSVGDDAVVRVWSMETGEAVRILACDSVANGVSISANGKVLAVALLNSTVYLCSLLDYSALLKTMLYSDAGVAPYVVLDVLNFLCADDWASFRGNDTFAHGYKISFIGTWRRRQQQQQ